MVSDVARGIGWGGEGDDSCECDEFELIDRPSRSRASARVSTASIMKMIDASDRSIKEIPSCMSTTTTTTTSSRLSTRSTTRSISLPRVQILSPDSGLRDLHTAK